MVAAAAARRHYRGLTWLGRARRAGGAPGFQTFDIFSHLFAYFFGIYIKFGYKNPSILTPYNSVDVAS